MPKLPQILAVPEKAPLYGSSRLVSRKERVCMNCTSATLPAELQGISYVIRGEKSYELSNHLGNVLAVVSDRREAGACTDSLVDFYYADGRSVSDYYPFGMAMDSRTQRAGGYRWGFNGQEKDDEIKDGGNSINYLARIYDPRLGRFLSVDPLEKEYPWYTPFQFAGNKPIAFIDRDGEEEARPEEIAYAILNPIDALMVRRNSQKAFQAAQNSGLPNPRDGLQDAFRHAYWNALNARDIGARNAEPFATIHETGMTNPANDPNSAEYDPVAIEMDLFNNGIGRRIGALNTNATDEELAALVMQALANGELKVVTNIGATNTSKRLGASTHPTLSPGAKVAPDYEATYDEFNGTEDTKREKHLETLPNSGTGADHTDIYSGQQMDRQARNAQKEY